MGRKNERRRRRLVYGILARIRLKRVSQRYDPTLVLAAFGFVNGGISIALLAIVALVTQEAFIFPSLGATAFILYYVPTAAAASPRNTVLGHLTGALVGWLSLAAFGLLDAPSAMQAGVDWARVGAVALSLASASGLMVLFRAHHPPAGATAMIVSLGLMPRLGQIPVLMSAVMLLLLQAYLMNRLAGIRFPLWSAPGTRADHHPRAGTRG